MTHVVTQIAEHTWHISEKKFTSMYLLEGTESALLIDTGCGLGDLYSVVKELTSLPLKVVLTHCHGDHAGGIGHFNEIYVHGADLPATAAMTAGHIAATLTFFTPEKFEVKAPNPATRFHAIKEGDTFDLGGRTVTVLEAPGHTLGSVMLLDSATEFLFSGDACNHNLLLSISSRFGSLMQPGICIASIEHCLQTLQKIRGLKFRENYTGHYDEIGEKPADPATADDLIISCEKILEDRILPEDEDVSPMGPASDDCRYIRHGSARLTYNPQKIHEDWVIGR